MSLNIIWLDKAVEELDQIYDFYFAKNPNAAIKIYNSILAQTRILENFPKMAAVEPLLKNRQGEFRSLVTKDGLFKIIYCTDDENVFITNVFCCWRDPGTLK